MMNYPNYGGRGIAVCAGWFKFENFYSDMGDRPEGLTIERINNDGNYSCGKCDQCKANDWPMNCEWADLHTQCRNARHNHNITINGVTKCLKDWCSDFSISDSAVIYRIRKAGLTPLEALTMPVGQFGKLQDRRSKNVIV